MEAAGSLFTLLVLWEEGKSWLPQEKDRIVERTDSGWWILFFAKEGHASTQKEEGNASPGRKESLEHVKDK